MNSLSTEYRLGAIVQGKRSARTKIGGFSTWVLMKLVYRHEKFKAW
ncbi:MAG: hypothetical protein WD267_01880 [Balneolales bacterium]